MTVAVKNQLPVVIPPAALRRAGFKNGQELEVKATGGVITILPKSASPNKAEQSLKRLHAEAPAWLKQTWAASKRNGTDKLTMRQIDAEVAAVRRGRGKKVSDPAR